MAQIVASEVADFSLIIPIYFRKGTNNFKYNLKSAVHGKLMMEGYFKNIQYIETLTDIIYNNLCSSFKIFKVIFLCCDIFHFLMETNTISFIFTFLEQALFQAYEVRKLEMRIPSETFIQKKILWI